ncbi:hypothetical protein [Prescottella agglutinans]|uniref:Uncharacterized protein n=1 Tax=Prescottella agglutinans TaxID=1644129 RepID=A0ABT6MFL0_9NOCA|nr:hypothetical protein [Prescottella agglutinans]MDH6282591.1 hypothetical protein [Prescottella agglutinans]
MTYDRTGELIDDKKDVRPPHDPRCQAGWLGTDPDDRPIPCLRCRPHLIRTRKD